MMVPKYADQPGYVIVDSTWGQIQPLEVAAGVQTIAELDVIEHLDARLPLVDTRQAEQHQQATIPAAAITTGSRSGCPSTAHAARAAGLPLR